MTSLEKKINKEKINIKVSSEPCVGLEGVNEHDTGVVPSMTTLIVVQEEYHTSKHVLCPQPTALQFVQVILPIDGFDFAVRVLGNNSAIIGPAVQKLMYSLFVLGTCKEV